MTWSSQQVRNSWGNINALLRKNSNRKIRLGEITNKVMTHLQRTHQKKFTTCSKSWEIWLMESSRKLRLKMLSVSLLLKILLYALWDIWLNKMLSPLRLLKWEYSKASKTLDLSRRSMTLRSVIQTLPKSSIFHQNKQLQIKVMETFSSIRQRQRNANLLTLSSSRRMTYQVSQDYYVPMQTTPR